MNRAAEVAAGRAAIRRILVALDASQESLAALTAAADMARRLHAELIGLFVEDADLFKLAEHSFVREISLVTHSGRRLELATIERELAAQAAAARRALERAAGAHRIPWSFRVARGAVAAELIAAAVEADLVALGKAIGPLSGRARLGRTVRALHAGSTCSLLFAVAEDRPGRAVALVSDGSPVSAAALDVAARIADEDGGRLLVFVIAEGAETAAAHEAEVRRRLRGARLVLEFRRVAGTGCAALRPAIDAARPKLFVVGVDPDGAVRAALEPVLEGVGCPVLLVRGGHRAT